MTGMERNADLIIMASYAPLLVNVNPDGMQWATDLIGYDY
jgi:alpha-N-arabinofuranosidase